MAPPGPVLALLLAAAAVAVLAPALAPRLGFLYPVPLVLGGLALGFVAGPPHVYLAPGTVFLLFLSPLIYRAALLAPSRDFRAELLPVLLLFLGSAATTTLSVAAVGHWAAGLPWPAAFVLGAVLSPMVPTMGSYTAGPAAGRPGPRWPATVPGGGDLLDGIVAVVLFRAALVAAVGAAHSSPLVPHLGAALGLSVGAAGGAAVGLALASVILVVTGEDPRSAPGVALSLLAPFLAYVAADSAGLAGIAAVVAAGLYRGRRQAGAAPAVAPRARSRSEALPGDALWDPLVRILCGMLFVLAGLGLRDALAALGGHGTPRLFAYAAAAGLTAFAARALWASLAARAPRRAPRSPSRSPGAWDPYANSYGRRQWVAAVAWGRTGGAVPVALALSVPLHGGTGAPFPDRDLLVFLALAAVLFALVARGLSSARPVRWPGTESDRPPRPGEASGGRAGTARGAPGRPGERRDAERPDDGDGDLRDYRERSASYERLMRELIRAQREALARLRLAGEIGDEAMRRVERDLDLEEERLED